MGRYSLGNREMAGEFNREDISPGKSIRLDSFPVFRGVRGERPEALVEIPFDKARPFGDRETAARILPGKDRDLGTVAILAAVLGRKW